MPPALGTGSTKCVHNSTHLVLRPRRCLLDGTSSSGSALSWASLTSEFVCVLRVATDRATGDCGLTFLPTFCVENAVGRPLEFSAMEQRRDCRYTEGRGIFQATAHAHLGVRKQEEKGGLGHPL